MYTLRIGFGCARQHQAAAVIAVAFTLRRLRIGPPRTGMLSIIIASIPVMVA